MKLQALFRFWNKVNKVGSVHPIYGTCWEWIGSLCTTGYGQIFVNGRSVMVHRFSWMLHFNDPKELDVLHKCDNTKCVNPDHLFLGTHSKNMEDCKEKGRNARGESHGFAKLTDEIVYSILDEYTPKVRGKGIRSLAKKYNIYPTTVLRIVRGRGWSHLPRPDRDYYK